jgi:hypothetical protein
MQDISTKIANLIRSIFSSIRKTTRGFKVRNSIYLLISILVLCFTSNNAYSNPNNSKLPSLMLPYICKENATHKELYEFGKILASGWQIQLEKHKSFDVRSAIKTRNDFFIHSYLGVKNVMTSSNNLDVDTSFERLDLCYRGYMSIAQSNPWSSVHSGLTDYLNPKDKSYFLNLPER